MPHSQEDYFKICTYLKSLNLTKAKKRLCTRLLTVQYAVDPRWILPNPVDCDCRLGGNIKMDTIQKIHCACV